MNATNDLKSCSRVFIAWYYVQCEQVESSSNNENYIYTVHKEDYNFKLKSLQSICSITAHV